MAKHRMVSTEVIFTDKFLRMSHSQMALYFAIMLLADDDGIYEAPKDLMRRIRVTEVDLKQLYDDGFILYSGDGAVAVAHWLWHNRIREGRYTPSKSAFVNELGVHDNGIYDYLADMNEGEPSLGSLIEAHNAYRQSLGKTTAEPIRRTKLKDVKRMALSLPAGENVNFEIYGAGVSRVDYDNSTDSQEHNYVSGSLAQGTVSKYLVLNDEIVLNDLIRVWVGDTADDENGYINDDETYLSFRLNSDYLAGLGDDATDALFSQADGTDGMLRLQDAAGEGANILSYNSQNISVIHVNYLFATEGGFSLVFDVYDQYGLINIPKRC